MMTGHLRGFRAESDPSLALLGAGLGFCGSFYAGVIGWPVAGATRWLRTRVAGEPLDYGQGRGSSSFSAQKRRVLQPWPKPMKKPGSPHDRRPLWRTRLFSYFYCC